MTSKSHRFQATVYRIWMMRHVDVPDEIARELQKEMSRDGAEKQREQEKSAVSGKPRDANPGRAKRGGAASKPARSSKYIPVVAVVNGKLARTTLMPAGGGRFRMQINTALRKAAGADVGDLVGVELRLDRESRDLPVPADLRAGLKAHPRAWKAFETLAPGYRRQVIAWFDSAKSPAARSRRLARAVDFLLERSILGPKR
jgi:Bacteriocin-protection, YdeI or OmpD-Associated/Domain of unknown function (DUF1905)